MRGMKPTLPPPCEPSPPSHHMPHVMQIVSVTTDTQLLEAFKELITQRVQSAPVWDVNTSAWIGWLELRDLVSFCVAESSPEKHGEQPLCGGHASAASAGPSLHHWLMKRADIEMPADVDETASKERPHKQVGEGKHSLDRIPRHPAPPPAHRTDTSDTEGAHIAFARPAPSSQHGGGCIFDVSHTCCGPLATVIRDQERSHYFQFNLFSNTQVAYLAKRNRVRTVQAGQSLPTAIHELAARGVHRLALVEPSDPLQITNIISQTSVLSFLYRCDFQEAGAPSVAFARTRAERRRTG
jgi:hypothetical protein